MKIETIIGADKMISFVLVEETYLDKKIIEMFSIQTEKNIQFGRTKKQFLVNVKNNKSSKNVVMMLNDYYLLNMSRMSNRLKNYLKKFLAEEVNKNEYIVDHTIVEKLQKFKYFGNKNQTELLELLIEDGIINKKKEVV